MKWIISTLTLIFSMHSIAASDFETVYEKKNAKVILTSSGHLSENDLNRYGKSVCSKNQFCVIWFYSNRKNADIGAAAMKKGEMFAVTPGMYGIFSKNKVANNVICYEPSSGC